MKHIQLLIFFLLLNISVKAQKVPYEKLEAFSKEISQIQFEANGKSYNDGTNDIEISFPEENFTVLFNSQLATNVVYKKSGSKELMYLTENISLGRVVGFTSEVMDNNIVVWKINFGKFTVTTQIFEDGKLIDTTYKSEMILYSYINSNKKATDPTFYKSFSELCNTMKKSIGMITDNELESENKDWEDKSNTMVNFVKKHPNSVRTMQGKNMIANKEKAILKKGETEFTNYYPFKYEIGLSAEETKRKYPDLKLKEIKDSDDLISSDEQYKFYVKNDMVYGVKGIIVTNIDRKNDFHIYSEMFKKGNETKKDLYSKFKFNPLVKQSDDFNYRSKSGSFDYSDIPIDEILYNGHLWCKDGDKVSYNWEKNGKTIQLDITVVKKNKLLTLLMGYTIAITIIKE